MSKLVKSLMLGFLVLISFTSKAEFEAGTHYIEIPFSESLKTGNKVEVREFFWYGCGHCFRFEPLLKTWKKNKPKAAQFVTTPAFLPKRSAHAKAYFAFTEMGKLAKLHTAFFNALHIDRRKLDTMEAIAGFVAEQGEDKKAFLKSFKSFATDHKVKQAMQLGQKYGVNSVPTLVVDGRYLTTAGMTGSHESMLKLVDYLVEKISKEKK